MRLPKFGRLVVAKRAPQRPLAAVGEFPQLLLVPADQRRDEQAGQAEIVVRLNRELHRGKQVLHRQRLVKMQAVDSRRRGHPPRTVAPRSAKQARRGCGPAPGRRPASAASPSKPAPAPPRSSAGFARRAPRHSGGRAARPSAPRPRRCRRRLFDGERLPQLDRARSIPVMRAVRWRRVLKRKRCRSDRLDHRIDHIEHRLRGAEAGSDRQVAEFLRAAADN